MSIFGKQKTVPPAHSENKDGGLPRFFTKQLFAFLLLAFLVIIVDFFLYALIAISESNRNFSSGTPRTTMRIVDENLTFQEGVYHLSDDGILALEQQSAWAALIDSDGKVVWEQNAPSDIPRSYSLNSIALAVHYANIADYPAFFWDRSDGLLVIGFPRGSYWHAGLSYPESTMRSLPLYILFIFAVDLAIFFVAYLISRRRTQKAVSPIVHALDDLSQGRPSTLNLKGDLQRIGQKITDTSAVIESKDTARTNWIRGVSHDIRTPLSMILGYADNLAENPDSPQDIRTQAAVIRTQGLKIKELVTDLNTASQLDFDMQPLSLERVHLARLLRSIAAAHINDNSKQNHPLEISIDPASDDLIVLGDERLLTRAIENVLTNAYLHNPEGCSITLKLTQTKQSEGSHTPYALVQITDQGTGISKDDLRALTMKLCQARMQSESFSRSVAPSTTNDAAEHGLGLILVDRIARVHGGFLEVSKSNQEGFSVEIALPSA